MIDQIDRSTIDSFATERWRAPCYLWVSMKRLKKLDPKKLSIDLTTIRVLTDAEHHQIVGGAPRTNTDTIGTSVSGACTKAPDTCA